jgi:glycerol-3-phosphate dehydrogenase
MASILILASELSGGGEQIHASYPNIKAEVIWAIRNEMAYKVEDVLARRMRILFVDARAAIEMCPIVAQLMAQEMQMSPMWVEEQILEFTQIASEYLLEPLLQEKETILT